MSLSSLTLTLEFARAEQTGDPYGFRFSAQDYLLRTAGGGFERATLGWNEALLSDLQAVRQPHCDPEVRQRIGETLRRFLVPLGWADLSAQILEAGRQGRRVCLSIRSAAAELYALPWELLTLKASGQHVGELDGVLLRYEWPETATTAEQPLPRAGSGRILFAWAAAGGAVPAAEHLQAISAACRVGDIPFDPNSDVIAHASLERLAAALAEAKRARRPISVLHLLCHGAAVGTTFGLVLNHEAQATEPVLIDAGRLRQLLAPHADMLRLVVLMACDSGNVGALGNQLGSVAQTLHRAGIAFVIASRFPLSVAGSVALASSFYSELLRGPESLETALLAARTRLAQDATTEDWASVQLYARASDGDDSRPLVFRPYQGLSSFQPEQSRFFFGRRALTETLWQRCRELFSPTSETRLLAVLGPSGSGKSSVARAGLLPELVRRPLSDWQSVQVVIVRPGDGPQKERSRVTAERAAASPGSTMLLLIDQFEELYTHCADARERDEFVAWLLQIARDRSQRVAIVLTLRSDFYGETQRHHAELNQLVAKQHELVPGLHDDELRSLIADPARVCGRPLDSETVEMLLLETRGNQGSLPLLEFALMRIWEGVLANRKPGDTLREIGGIGGALADQARKLYGGLEPRAQATAKRAFVRMVRLGEGTRDTRKRTSIAELCGYRETAADVLSVLRKFAAEESRIVTLSIRGDDTLAEVTHEALFEHWTELRSWIDEGREDRRFYDRVSEATALWDRDRSKSGRLWRAPDLDLLRAYRTRKREELSAAAEAFFLASESAQQAEEALRRRVLLLLRGGVIALSILLLAAVGFAFIARQQKSIADQETQNARRERDLAEQRELDMVVEEGRLLLIDKEHPDEALWRLIQARDRRAASASLPYLLREAARPLANVELQLKTPGVHGASYSPDGSRLVVTIYGEAPRVVDAQSGETLATLKGGELWCSASYSPDGGRIVATSESEEVRMQIFDARTGESLVSFAEQSGSCGARFSPDGNQVVTLSADRTAKVYDARSGQLLRTLSGHTGKLTAVNYSPDSTRIVTTSLDTTARIFDARTGQLVTTLTGHSSDVHSACFSPDGNRVVTASADHTARIFDVHSGELLTNINYELAAVHAAEFSPDGTDVVLGTAKGDIQIHDARTGELQVRLQRQIETVESVSYSPDGNHLVSATALGVVRVHDLRGVQPLMFLPGHRAATRRAHHSSDGSRIVTASEDQGVRIFDARSGQPLGELPAHAAKPTDASYSPDGTRIVVASEDKTVRIYDTRSRQVLRTLSGLSAKVSSARYSPDGSRIVTASADKTAKIHDAQSGGLLATLSGHSAELYAAEYSPDGSRIVTASADQTAKIYDAQSGKLLATLVGHSAAVVSASFSRDGRRVVTASQDKTARVFELATSKLLFTLIGHQGALSSARYSHDGIRIVTASADKTVRLWDADRGQLLATLIGHSEAVLDAEFGSDDRRVLTASADRTVRLFDVAAEARSSAELKKLLACHSDAALGDVGLPRVADAKDCNQRDRSGPNPATWGGLRRALLSTGYALRAGQAAAAARALARSRAQAELLRDPEHLAWLALAEAALSGKQQAPLPATVSALMGQVEAHERPRAWLELSAFAGDVLYRPHWALSAAEELQKILPKEAGLRADARAKLLEAQLAAGVPASALRLAPAVFAEQPDPRGKAFAAALSWAAAWQQRSKKEQRAWAAQTVEVYPQSTDLIEEAPRAVWTFDGIRHLFVEQPPSAARTAALSLFVLLHQNRDLESDVKLSKLLGVPVPEGVQAMLDAMKNEEDLR